MQLQLRMALFGISGGSFWLGSPNLAEPASPCTRDWAPAPVAPNQSSQKLLFQVSNAFSTCPFLPRNPATANKRLCKYLHFVSTHHPSPRSYPCCRQTHTFTPDLIKVEESEPGFDPVSSSPSSSLLSSLSAIVERTSELVSCSWSTPRGVFLN